MLVGTNISGSEPPAFFVHGNNGVMPVGSFLSSVFGPDRPVYAIHAKGFDGGKPHESVPEMVEDYVAEIVAAEPTGPLIIAGQCWGSLVALEIARTLLDMGRVIGPAILVDPPRVPYGQGAASQDENMSEQLYRYVQDLMLKLARVTYYDVPFDARDPEQLHMATVTGVAAVTAISRFSPKPFLGYVTLVLGSDLTPSFFGPAAHWKKVLPNSPIAHSFPYGHLELFSKRRYEVARLLKFVLAESFPDPNELG